MKKLAAAVFLSAAVLAGCNAETQQPPNDVALVVVSKKAKKDAAEGAEATQRVVMIRYNTVTGAAAVNTGKGWTPITDATPPTNSVYRVEAAQAGGAFQAVRIDQNTGKVWILQKREWAEVPDMAAAADTEEGDEEAAEGEAAAEGDAAAEGEKEDGEKKKKKKNKE